MNEMNREIFKDYLEKIQEIEEQMEDNGGSKLRNKSVHAGQILLYDMASSAQAAAQEAKTRALKNFQFVQALGIVVMILVLFHGSQIPDILNGLGRLLGLI